MELSTHIKHLLYNNNCVIVPNFGGFVCAHKKLEFNIHTGLIHPPRKTVSFNLNLNNNDDLLANHIANKKNISYTQALENINAWVSNLNKKLQNGETINIDGLGSFSLTGDKKVLFVPFANANFLTDSYGLKTVTLNKKVAAIATPQKEKVVVPPLAIKEPTKTNKTVETPTSKPIIEPISNETIAELNVPAPPKPQQRKPRKTLRKLRRVFAVMFTLLLFLALFISQDYFYHYKMEQSNHQKHNTKKSTSTPTKNEKTPAFESETIIPNEEYSINNAYENTSNSNDDAANSLENSTVTQPSVETSMGETAKTDSVFYIIAGAFSSESNAQDLLDELNRKGFAPEIINVQGSSLYRVGYQRYTSRKKAEANLNSTRNNTHNFAAWVLAVKP